MAGKLTESHHGDKNIGLIFQCSVRYDIPEMILKINQYISTGWTIRNWYVPVISKTLEHIETFNANYKDSS